MKTVKTSATGKIQRSSGYPVSIPVPGESTVYAARYAVWEADELQPSHNAQNFQANPRYAYQNDRDYSKPESQARVIAQAQRFEPQYLLNDNPDAVNGPPIIDTAGNVLGGNSRAMTLQRVYVGRDGEAAVRYLQVLKAKAPSFGIDPEQLRPMRQPVLVRELSKISDAPSAITDFNKTGTASLSPSERAVTDGRRASSETLQYLASQIEAEGEDGTIAKALSRSRGTQIIQRLIDDKVLTPQERPQYVDERGLVTSEGKQRVTRLMVGRIFDHSDDYETTAPALREKLEKIVAPLSRVEGQTGWDITPPVKEAVCILNDAHRRSLKNIEDLRAQQGLFESSAYSDAGFILAHVLQDTPAKTLAKPFRQYAEEAQLSAPGQTVTFFQPPTAEQSFAEAFHSGAPVELNLSSPKEDVMAAITVTETGENIPETIATPAVHTATGLDIAAFLHFASELATAHKLRCSRLVGWVVRLSVLPNPQRASKEGHNSVLEHLWQLEPIRACPRCLT